MEQAWGDPAVIGGSSVGNNQVLAALASECSQGRSLELQKVSSTKIKRDMEVILCFNSINKIQKRNTKVIFCFYSIE